MDIGKAVIAATLIPFENDYVFNYSDDNWLRYAYDKLNIGFDEFSENQLSFITFNYDRVVEWFLVTALSNSYGKPKDACVDVLKSIPIIHLHGRLGYLPWETSRIESTRDFNNAVHRDTLRVSVNEIKIIHEDISDGRDKDFQRARELLNDAKKIYFLGFGFHRTNVDRLGISTLADAGKSLATGYGLTGRERTDITLKRTNGRVLFADPNGTCIDLCRNMIDWS